MTVKLLVDWEDSRDRKKYLVGNLLTTDAGTESGLVAARLATTTLTGGTAYIPPAVTPLDSSTPALVINNPLTGGKALKVGSETIPLNPTAMLTRPLNVVTFGPSISAYGFYDTATNNNYQYGRFSEIAYLLSFTGPMLMQTLIGGKTARTDDCGNYGYSGQESNTLLTDSETLWVPQLRTVNYVPDMIVYTGLVANDIPLTGDATVIKKRVLTLLRAHKARWPGLIQVLPTPHPGDTRLNTQAKKDCFLEMRLWMLSLDNGNDLLVPDLCGEGSYADPADITLALPYYSYNTNAGALDDLRDVYGVHPNARGCQVNAKIIAKKIKSYISNKLPSLSLKFVSLNPTLSGSAVLSTNGTGTVPTPGSYTQAIALQAGASCVSSVTGLEPWTVTLTPDTPVNGVVLSGGFNFQGTGAGANPGAVEFGSIHKVRIVSGARSLCGLQGSCTSNEGTNGNLTNRGGANGGSKSFYPDWDGGPSGYEDGDIVWGISPRRTLTVPPTTTFTQLGLTIGKPYEPVVLEILQAGYLTS